MARLFVSVLVGVIGVCTALPAIELLHQEGTGYGAKHSGLSEGSLSGGHSLVGGLESDLHRREEYGAKESGRAEAIGAAGIRDKGIEAKEAAGHELVNVGDAGYIDSGFRNAKGNLEFGRSTSFKDSARDASYALDVDGVSAGVVDADTSGYAHLAKSSKASGGVENEGGVYRGEKAVAGLEAIRKIVGSNFGTGHEIAAVYGKRNPLLF